MKWMVKISNLNLNTIHFAHCVRLVAATRRIEDHFVDITEMVDIGSGAQRLYVAIHRTLHIYLLFLSAKSAVKEIFFLTKV